MKCRAVYQDKRRGRYVLYCWNPETQEWEIASRPHDKPFPGIPLFGEGWVFQHYKDGKWRSHGSIFPRNERPSSELFEEFD